MSLFFTGQRMNENNNAQRMFFFVLLFAVTLAFLWLIRGFLQPIFWAIAFGIIIFPVHGWLVARLHGRETVAAMLSVLLLVIVVILPLIGVAAAVTNEAAGLVQRLSAGGLDFNGLYSQAQDSMPRVIALLQRLGIDPEKIESQLSEAAVNVSRFVASSALSIGKDSLRATVFFFLMLYLLFFFLRDGTRLLEGLVRALPLGDERERALFARFAEVSRATIKGTLVVGAVQGTIGGVAFALIGVGAPVLWGVVMALASLVPAAGPALVWLPAAIILLASGHVIAGVLLILIGVFVIGLVDNLLRPVLVGRDTRMPDYLILLSTLGGLAGFGFAGIVIGPIIAALFLSIWQMAQEEFGPDEPSSEAAARATPATPSDGGRK
ncbi:MAG TPA: AI-2E family transporter [Gammaproteobacteria bacterium]|nr:AI-2E family transporter [Gammaproteobacteria bacterium]